MKGGGGFFSLGKYAYTEVQIEHDIQKTHFPPLKYTRSEILQVGLCQKWCF